MGNCDTEFVTGECHGDHVGKFSSCLDEALHEMSIEFDEGIGDPDFGYAAPVKVADGDPDASECCTLSVPGFQIAVPGGYYIVFTASTGQVSAVRYEDENAAEEAFDVWRLEFETWAALAIDE